MEISQNLRLITKYYLLRAAGLIKRKLIKNWDDTKHQEVSMGGKSNRDGRQGILPSICDDALSDGDDWRDAPFLQHNRLTVVY
jgi:hypothetical protein